MTTFDFGQWVKRLRTQMGLSRQQVCERAGGNISQQYIHFIEQGRATNIGSDKIQALAQGLNIPIEAVEEALFHARDPVIPLLGRVPAGRELRLQSSEYQQGETLSYQFPQQGLFAVEIMGDSMAPKIEHGDIAVAKPWASDEAIVEGRIYLLRQEGKITCKYLLRKPDNLEQYWLVAENAALFPPIPMTADHQIIGRVVEVRKSLNLARPVLDF